jgi:hypothetical protein
MQKNFIKLLILASIILIPSFAMADDVPFTIGDPVVEGNGCPEGTYDVLLSDDGNELTVLFNSFTAETTATSKIDWANCNIAVPIEVPSGVTVGLLGVDYRGIALIPSGGRGMLSREYFFAGTRGPRITSVIDTYDIPTEFYYPDDLEFVAWTQCGDDVNARSNATLYVTRPSDSPVEAIMSMFSEDWEISILFNLEWKYCDPNDDSDIYYNVK